MTIKDLKFALSEQGKTKGSWAAKFVSEGPVGVQLTRAEQGNVTVYANIPGMEPCVIDIHRNPYGASLVFGVDVVAGMEVTVASATEVTAAKMMGGDGCECVELIDAQGVVRVVYGQDFNNDFNNDFNS